MWSSLTLRFECRGRHTVVIERIQAVVRPLANGKKAVKHISPTGEVEYLILDANDRPCEPPATTLAELLQRYPL